MSIDEKWTKLPPMSTEREGCAAVELGGKVYVIGGKDDNWNNLSSGEVYDPIRKTWSHIPSMWTKRRGCAAVVLGRQIYVVGGNDAHTVHSSGELFDPISQSWTDLPPMNKKRSSCAAVKMGGLIYVIGGYDENYLDHSSVEVYNPSTQCWTLLPPMTTGRSGCAAVKMGGRIYVLGGSNAQISLSSVEVFDPKTQCWKSNRAMLMQRYACAAVGMGGHIYAIGGLVEEGEYRENYLTSSVEKFTPSTKHWTSIPSMGTERQSCAAVGVGGRIYVVGGFTTPGTRLKSVESIHIQTNFTASSTSRTKPPQNKRRPKHRISRNKSSVPTATISAIPPPPKEALRTKKISSRNKSCVSSTTTPASHSMQQTSSTATRSRASLDQPTSSQLRQTMQLFQSKIPTATFVPVTTAEVVQVEESRILQPLPATASNILPNNLKKATTEQICQWLLKRGVSTASLDVLRREEIDGTFLFEEAIEDVRSMLKEEGIKLGQISKIRSAVEEAKREGALV